VIHNLTARGSASGMLTAYNLAAGLGLDLEPIEAVAAVDRDRDNGSGARHPALAVFSHGINDQQQLVAPETLKANTITGILAARHADADALVTIPALEAAQHQDLAEDYRAALQEAADETGAARIDIGKDGALPDLVAGLTTNPHLTEEQYTTQGDFIADVLLAR
jgi:hypothetical protein